MGTGKDLKETRTARVRKLIHVYSGMYGWSVRADSSARARRNFHSKEDAVAYAQNLMQLGWSLVIHKENGAIESIIRNDGTVLL